MKLIHRMSEMQPRFCSAGFPAIRPLPLLALLLCLHSGLWSQADTWQTLAEGLNYGRFAVAGGGDETYTIFVLKIDPAAYEFELLNASEHGNRSRTLSQWAGEFGLLATINAGMYQKDLLTSVGYMKKRGHVNNPYLNRNNTVLAFCSSDNGMTPAHIIDRTCEDFDSLRSGYDCFVQSIRMIGCDRKNVWSRQPNRWSIAALGEDADGNLLLIFSPSPFTVHDFINHLLALPIAIQRAMYLEGGSKAGFFLSHGNLRVEQYGTYDNAFLGAQTAWPLPNVLGIRKKSGKAEGGSGR